MMLFMKELAKRYGDTELAVVHYWLPLTAHADPSL